MRSLTFATISSLLAIVMLLTGFIADNCGRDADGPVSYTHLTLPTIYSV